MQLFWSIVRKGVLGVALLGSVYYLWYSVTPCHVPITYSLGSIDERFEISEEELIAALEEAEAVWEKSAGTELFVRKENGGMPINLVYDQRQAVTERNNELKEQISDVSETADSVRAAYDAAQARLESLKASYELSLATYEKALAAYNERVEYWNARGGAPANEYKKLQALKATLEVQEQTVAAGVAKVNAAVREVNSLSERYNTLAQSVNTTVDKVNETAGREFEEGLYSKNALGAKIDIYEFSDRADLVRVLTHELGHALGLTHTENPDSIMYPVNESENMTLTKEDLSALSAVCGV